MKKIVCKNKKWHELFPLCNGIRYEELGGRTFCEYEKHREKMFISFRESKADKLIKKIKNDRP